MAQDSPHPRRANHRDADGRWLSHSLVDFGRGKNDERPQGASRSGLSGWTRSCGATPFAQDRAGNRGLVSCQNVLWTGILDGLPYVHGGWTISI
jgi:hypothetical protein